MSDYISKSATIENIKAEIQCVEKEKQSYFEQGNFHNGNILVEKIQAMKLVLKIVANEPTLDEKEIIRKAFERVVERLEVSEEQADIKFHDFMDNNEACHLPCEYNKADLTFERLQVFGEAIEIVKEEGGIE